MPENGDDIRQYISGADLDNGQTYYFRAYILFNETMPCIRCGLCVKHCPVGANPVTGYKMDKCIKCGACKYVCPSNISLGEKNE